MLNAASHQITLLLIDWSKGDEFALERLMPLVCGELRQMARHYMRRQPSKHTFQTTELIHEAYLKLAKQKDLLKRMKTAGIENFVKRCPECRRDYYDGTLLFCLEDGARLLEGPATDETNTKILGVTDLANRKPRFLTILQANRRPDSKRAKPPRPKTDYRTIF